MLFFCRLFYLVHALSLLAAHSSTTSTVTISVPRTLDASGLGSPVAARSPSGMLANWVWLIAWCMLLTGILRGEGGQGSLSLQRDESRLNELLFVIAELRLRGKRKDISRYHSGTLIPPVPACAQAHFPAPASSPSQQCYCIPLKRLQGRTTSSSVLARVL